MAVPVAAAVASLEDAREPAPDMALQRPRCLASLEFARSLGLLGSLGSPLNTYPLSALEN